MYLYTSYKKKVDSTNNNNKNAPTSAAAAHADAPPAPTSGTKVPAPLDQVKAFVKYIYTWKYSRTTF